MSQGDGPIETYLDDLLGRLIGGPAQVRRALREAEDHLYSAADAAAVGGTERYAAETLAVEQFGTVGAVAASFNRAHRSATVREVVELLAGLAGLGLVAIGLSGLVEMAMTAVWGKVWVFADPPGTHYPASSCRYWESIHPHAAGCAQAYLAESMSDGLLYRFALGAFGVLLLAGLFVVMRRRGRSLAASLSSPLAVGLGGTAFLVGAAVFLAVGADRYGSANGNGAGQWFSAVVVSLPAAAVFLAPAVKRIRRVGPPVWFHIS